MMYCQACGHQIHETAAACPSCEKPNMLLRSGEYQQSGWFSFKGRIPRKVFWLHYALPIWAVGVLAAIIDPILHAHGVLRGLVTIAFFVPNLAASVKRLHDRDHSGWLLLVMLIPIVGFIWIFVVTGFLRGTRGPNRFGGDPLPDYPFPAETAAASY